MKKTLITALLVLACVPAIAKDNPSSEKSNGKKNDVMPVAASSSSMSGYEETKKMLNAAEPSLKEKAAEAVEKVVEKAVEAVKEAVSKKGDPAPKKKDTLDYYSFISATKFESGSTVSVSYFYEPTDTNPYDKMIATYSISYNSKNHKPVSATGYQTLFLDSVPDLTGMVLASTAVRSDGTLASAVYQSGPDENGTTRLISILYDSAGEPSLVRQIISQSLDVKDGVLRKLYREAFPRS